MGAPGPDSGTQSLQVLSGVGVLPSRTLSVRDVLAGVALFHEAVPQGTGVPASKTLDKYVPDVALIRSQSTDTPPFPTSKSLTAGRIAVVMETSWWATCWPSMK